jgi:capsular polysaccharide biosynthesis protein
VEVSKLEPVDQLELFISAKAIAGVHGAGLMNMIFMSREARYVEITLDPQPHWVYRLAERYFQERAVIACQLDGSVMTCPISQLEEVL